jgi:protein-S-isoprenylcysteine O-methyltransferase Ste14
MIALTPSHMALCEKVIATCFIAGVALMSIGLYDNRKSTYSTGKPVQLGSSRTFSFFYRYIQASTIVCTLGGCLFYDRLFLDIHDNTVVFYCGLAITAGATILFVHAKLVLGTNYSPCFDAFLPLSITTRGAYGYVRHPLYLSNLLVLAGAFVMSGSLWVVFNWIALACFYYAAAIREEAELCRSMAGYSEYVSQTGRFFPKLLRRCSVPGKTV